MAEAASKLPTKTERETTERGSGEWPPLVNLRREIDRLFEDFGFGGGRRAVGRSMFDVEPFWRGELTFDKTPAVDIVEKDKEYEITAELPGLDESNVEVKFADGFLTIKGEKREEKEEKKKDYYLSERLSLPQISSEWREKTNRVILASNVGRLQIALVAAHRVIPITSVA